MLIGCCIASACLRYFTIGPKATSGVESVKRQWLCGLGRFSQWFCADNIGLFSLLKSRMCCMGVGVPHRSFNRHATAPSVFHWLTWRFLKIGLLLNHQILTIYKNNKHEYTNHFLGVTNFEKPSHGPGFSPDVFVPGGWRLHWPQCFTKRLHGDAVSFGNKSYAHRHVRATLDEIVGEWCTFFLWKKPCLRTIAQIRLAMPEKEKKLIAYHQLRNVQDNCSQIPGVADIHVWGKRSYQYETSEKAWTKNHADSLVVSSVSSLILSMAWWLVAKGMVGSMTTSVTKTPSTPSPCGSSSWTLTSDSQQCHTKPLWPTMPLDNVLFTTCRYNARHPDPARR